MEDYEEFSENQKKLLARFVTSTSSSVFVLRNLPEVIKGALFSRYSRSSSGLRTLLLKEFIHSQETAFQEMVGPESGEELDKDSQLLAIKKAQDFYDRILDGYGDDSIGELGGTHLAVENLSMIAAKMLEDCRIGGAFLEKSTRYIYFDQKVKGSYLYYKEPVLMTSAYRDLFLKTSDMLFETYSKLIPPTTEMMEKRFAKEPDISKAAYTAALRAKVLDLLRGLLPAGTLTNMGIFGNGRFFENLLHKLHCHSLAELQDIGKKSYEELHKVIPSFVRRADTHHRHHEKFATFYETMRAELATVREHHEIPFTVKEAGVRLIAYDAAAEVKVAAALLYPYNHASLEELQRYCQKLSPEERAKIFDAASTMRENRRHKSPRALEQSFFTFEIVADFGAYRDLHRHRMLSQERQLLGCSYGYYIPPELVGTAMEKSYREAMDQARIAYDQIAKELAEEAQYIVPMAYNVSWYFHLNLRALQWLCELRSSPAGHSNYRYIAQALVKEVTQIFPSFETFFKFVDFEGYGLGRIQQEQRTALKKAL